MKKNSAKPNCSIKLSFLVTLFSITLLQHPYAQWQSLGRDIIPFGYSANSLRITEDNAIWILLTEGSIYNYSDTGAPIILQSVDMGETWIKQQLSQQATGAFGSGIAPIDHRTAFLALYDQNGFLKTTDGGKNWSKVGNYPFYPMGIHFFNETDGIIISDIDRTFDPNGIIISVTADGGNNWTHLGGNESNWRTPPGTSLPDYEPFDYFASVASNRSPFDFVGDTIVLGMGNGSLLISKDKGYNWKRINTPLKNFGRIASNVTIKDLSTIMVIGDRLTSDVSGVNSLSYTTTDGGETWIVGNPPIAAHATQYISGSDSTFIVSSIGHYNSGANGTVISYDFGATWQWINDIGNIISMDFNDRAIGIAASGNSQHDAINGDVFLWEFQLSTSTQNISDPSALTLAPNPVKDILTLLLENRWRGRIQISITNVLGQRLFLESTEKDSDLFQKPIALHKFPAGKYWLTLTDGTQLITRAFLKK